MASAGSGSYPDPAVFVFGTKAPVKEVFGIDLTEATLNTHREEPEWLT
jgi:hypothetical protein